MRALRDKVLKTIVLRRTKEGRQADMLLPERFITVKKTGLSEAEKVEFFFHCARTYLQNVLVARTYAHN